MGSVVFREVFASWLLHRSFRQSKSSFGWS
jgi:hypothetical protein